MKKIALFTIALCVLFTGCKNFLNGADFLESLEDAINYNNAKEMTVRVQTKKEYGEFVNSGDITKRVGDVINLEFELNSSEYVFNKWQIISRDAQTAEPEKCVELTQTQKGSTYYLDVKLLSYAADLMIEPSCFEIPKVSDFLPEYDRNGVPQDSSIIITFSKPVAYEYFFDEETNGFKNIEIDDGGTSLIYDTDDNSIFTYYKKPFISDDNLTLTIPRNMRNQLIPLDYEYNTKEITVSLKLRNLKDSVAGEGLSFSENKTYSFRVNKTQDENPPEIEQIKIFKTKKADGTYSDELSQETILKWTDETCSKNYIGNKVYIYCKASDVGGGVCGLKVKETRIRDEKAAEAGGTADYSAQTITFTEAEFYEGYCEYTIRMEDDGVIKLEVIVYDYAQNESQSFYAGCIIKNSKVNIPQLKMWNDDYADGVAITPAGQWSSNVGSMPLYWDCSDKFYGDYSVPAAELGYVIEWGNDKENLQYKKEFARGENKTCSCVMDNINNTENTYVKITVVGLYGAEKSYSGIIPRYAEITAAIKIDQNKQSYFLENLKIPDSTNYSVSYKLMYKKNGSFSTSYINSYGVGNFGKRSYEPCTCITGKDNLEECTVEAFVQTYIAYNTPALKYDFYSSIPSKGCFLMDAIDNYSGYKPEIEIDNIGDKIHKEKQSLGTVYVKFLMKNPSDFPDDTVFYGYVSEYNKNYQEWSIAKCTNFQKINRLIVDNSGDVLYEIEAEPGLGLSIYGDFYLGLAYIENNQWILGERIQFHTDASEYSNSPIYFEPTEEWLPGVKNVSAGNSMLLKERYLGEVRKVARGTKNLIQYEYTWIPYEKTIDLDADFLPKFIEAEASLYKYTTGFGLDLSDTSTLLASYPFKDLKENTSYLLLVKNLGIDEDCFYYYAKSFFYLRTLKNRIKFEDMTDFKYARGRFTIDEEPLYSSDTNLKSYYYLQTVSFDESIQYWNESECYVQPLTHYSPYNVATSPMQKDNSKKQYWEICNFDKDKFYKANVRRAMLDEDYDLSDEDQNFYISYPLYFYTRTDNTPPNNLKDIVEGKYSVIVMADAPCLYTVYCSSVEGGYGDDIDEWQHRSAEILSRQITASETADISLVPKGDYYIVIARYADGTVLTSDVRQKQ